MPPRLEPFINDHIYHVFNKTIDGRRIFESEKYANLFINTCHYYRSSKAEVSFSVLSRLNEVILKSILRNIDMEKYFRIEILAYVIMPTHYHLLIKQKRNEGVPRFMSDIINSLTRYFNVKNSRKGPLFLPKFKSVMIKTDEQLMHVSRYIHLNPYSNDIIEFEKLQEYPWSSYRTYIRDNSDQIISGNNDIFLLFNHDKTRYRKFVESHAEYQRTLELIKHAEKW